MHLLSDEGYRADSAVVLSQTVKDGAGGDKWGGGNPIAHHKGKLSDQGAWSGVSSAAN